MPNQFGGDPIRANVSLFLDTFDVENKTCVLNQHLDLNSDDAKNLIMGLLQKMELMDKELEHEMGRAIYDITDNNRYEFYYYPGIPIKIETERNIVVDIAGNRGKVYKKTIIELIE
jgi:hypothetical protein